MARRTDRPDSAARRRVTLALSAALLVIGVGGTVVYAQQALDRVRVDTSVQAVAQGRAGCVDAAVFTDPDGVERRVDITRYGASCLEGDPGDRVAVYYDADEPGVSTASRAWWWSLVGLAGGLGLTALALHGAWWQLPRGRTDRAAS